MAIINFENGTSVNFDGQPTQQDIEDVANKLGLNGNQNPTDPTANPFNSVNSQQNNLNQPQISGNTGGFWSNLVKDAIRPFGELGVTAYNVGQSIGGLLNGDNNAASSALSQSRNLPFLGNTKPAFTGDENFTQNTGKILSYGGTVGSWEIGGGEAGAAGEGLAQGARTLAGQSAKDIIQGNIIPAALKGAAEFAPSGVATGLGEGLQNISPDNSAGTNAVKVATDTVLGGTGAALAGGLGAGLFAGGSSTLQKVIDHFQPLEDQASNAINEAIDKSIKPSFGKVSTPAARNSFYQKAAQAFEVINKYKPVLTDEAGQQVNRNPQTLSELFEAIGQAKTAIFGKYDSIASESGNAGAKYNAQPLIDKLQSLVDNKGYSPETRSYIQSQIPAIQELNGQSPSVIQHRLQEYNFDLNKAGAFSGRVTRAQINVDASIAESLRSDLNDLIEKSTGKQYAALKSEYGALRAIQDEVGRQVAVQARKASKGLLSFTDIFTGGDITSGVLTHNPALIAKGVGGRVIKGLYERLNNPDTYIKNAFGLLDKIPLNFSSLAKNSGDLLNTLNQ